MRLFGEAYYWVDKKEYKRQTFSENVELLSCSGNLAVREGKAFLHLYVTAGLEDFSVVGGHLFKGEVTVTAEVIFRPMPKRVDRVYDPTTGLYLLDLPLRKAV